MSDTILSSETTTTMPLESMAAPAVAAPVESAPVESAPGAAPSAAALAEILSPELRDASNLKNFKTADDLAKSYVELQRMVGNSVRIPAADASPEAKKDFLEKIKGVEGILMQDDPDLMTKLGRPETPDLYSFELPEGIAEIDPTIDTELGEFRKVAHELGLTKEQASKLVNYRMSTLDGMIQQQEQVRATAEAQLRKTWGPEFDSRLDGAKKVLTVFKDKYGEQVMDLVNGPAGNNVAFLQMASELAAMYAEKQHEGMQGATFGTTPDQALSKIADKRADRGFMKAYMDPFDPGHKEAKAEMTKLYKLANGS
jgi:hypothetical protein